MTMQAKWAAVAVALVTAASAQAADLYLGGAIGNANLKEDLGVVPAAVSVDKRDTGVKLYLGSNLLPNLAVEGGYVDLGKFTVSSGGLRAGLQGEGYFVDLLGRLPVSAEVSLLAKLGVFNGHAKTFGLSPDFKDSGTDLKLGLGAAYAITKNVSVRAEWERYRFKFDGDKSNVDLVSVGLSYGF